ncbi:MAG: DNA-binding protein [Flavobacterium sp.]|nr:MAG: DNA-binding protein [Flavobacterium sp.]
MEREDRPVTYREMAEFREAVLVEIRQLLKGSGTKKWLKSKDVRKILGISAGKLQAMRNNKEIPFTKVGASIFYKEEDVFNL